MNTKNTTRINDSTINAEKQIGDTLFEEKLILRPLNFQKDFDQLIELYDLVFESELTAKGTSARKMLEDHKKVLPLLRIIGIFSKGLKHTMDGFIFENREGKIITSVSISYSFSYWEIAMVATHPDYRRKGLARKLLLKAIQHAKKHKAKLCALEVISDNTPAYSLYSNMGFIHYDSFTKLNIDVKNIPELINEDFPTGYEILELKKNMKTNQARYELAIKSTPENVNSLIPVNKKLFFKPFIIRIARPVLIKILGLQFKQLGIYYENKLVGTVFVDLREKEKSIHELEIIIDPDHEEILAKPMITLGLNHSKNHLDSNDKIYCIIRSSSQKTLNSCKEVGFQKFEQDHYLALKF